MIDLFEVRETYLTRVEVFLIRRATKSNLNMKRITNNLSICETSSYSTGDCKFFGRAQT